MFLYGAGTTPSSYADRLRPSTAQAPTIDIAMPTFMSSGPGKYAHVSISNFVKKFFEDQILTDGTYTVADLKANSTLKTTWGYIDNDFNIPVNHRATDITSSDYAMRTYIYNTSGFKLSEETTFVVDGANRYIQSGTMKVWAYTENFDFESNSEFTYLGNTLYLKPIIDPYNLGKPDSNAPVKTVTITFSDKESVAAYGQYDIDNYNAEKALVDSQTSSLFFYAYPAYSAMEGVIDSLIASGTIDYDTASGEIIYGSNNSEVIVGTSGSDIFIAGEGDDLTIGNHGIDTAVLDGTFDDYRAGMSFDPEASRGHSA